MGARLIYEDNGRRLLVKMDGEDKSILIPLAFNHLALMEYRPDLDIEIILLFEKLLVFFRLQRLNPFNYQQDRLISELHIKRYRLNKARTMLKKAGILLESKPRKGEMIKLSLNINNIIASIPFLYKMPDDKVAKEQLIMEYQTFFKYYLSKKYLREKTDPSVPDEVHTGGYSIIHKENTGSKNAESENGENDTFVKEV